MKIEVQNRQEQSIGYVKYDGEINDIIQEGIDAAEKGIIVLPATILDNVNWLIKLLP